MELTGSEHDVLLAALRLWQASSWHDPELLEIAANGSEHKPLADADIEARRRELNE